MMRADPDLVDSVFIAQTGWSQPEHFEKSKKVGFDHHWVKPISRDALDALLKSVRKNGRLGA